MHFNTRLSLIPPPPLNLLFRPYACISVQDFRCCSIINLKSCTGILLKNNCLVWICDEKQGGEVKQKFNLIEN